jgi:DNA-binding NarL/FixJ family response regulator
MEDVVQLNQQHEANTVFVVDPSPVFIAGLTLWLDHAHYTLCHQAYGLEEIESHICACKPDYFISFIGPNFCTRNAFIACRSLRVLAKNSRIAFISRHAGNALFREDAIAAGALACLSVSVAEAALHNVLPMLRAGILLIPATPEVRQVQSLSERELDVLRLLAAGMTNSEIAHGLCISAKTTDKHVQHILQKLCVHNRNDAVQRAYHRGLL